MTNLISRDGFYVRVSRSHIPSMDEICSEIVKQSGYSATLLKSKTRKQEIRVWRQLGMYLMIQQGNCSLSAIGLYWGGRDHSTAISARNKIQDLIDINDPIVMDKMRMLNSIYSVNPKPLNYSVKRYGKA